MSLTPRAEALRAPLKSLLADVLNLIDPPEVALADIKMTLRLSMADYPALFVIGPLQQALQTSAPGIDLVIQPWHGAEAAQAGLLDGSTDLAISVFPSEKDEIVRELLLDETYVVAMRSAHPAATHFDLDSWIAYPHILVSGRGDTRTSLDATLADIQLSRRVGLVVPNFQMVPGLLMQSDMIAMLPSRCVPGQDQASLISFPPPIAVKGFALHLAWHRRRQADRGLRHVADLLAEILT